MITKIEPALFETVTGLTVKDFHLLVRLKVFNTEHMNQAVFAFPSDHYPVVTAQKQFIVIYF